MYNKRTPRNISNSSSISKLPFNQCHNNRNDIISSSKDKISGDIIKRQERFAVKEIDNNNNNNNNNNYREIILKEEKEIEINKEVESFQSIDIKESSSSSFESKQQMTISKNTSNNITPNGDYKSIIPSNDSLVILSINSNDKYNNINNNNSNNNSNSNNNKDNNNNNFTISAHSTPMSSSSSLSSHNKHFESIFFSNKSKNTNYNFVISPTIKRNNNNNNKIKCTYIDKNRNKRIFDSNINSDSDNKENNKKLKLHTIAKEITSNSSPETTAVTKLDGSAMKRIKENRLNIDIKEISPEIHKYLAIDDNELDKVNHQDNGIKKRKFKNEFDNVFFNSNENYSHLKTIYPINKM